MAPGVEYQLYGGVQFAVWPGGQNDSNFAGVELHQAAGWVEADHPDKRLHQFAIVMPAALFIEQAQSIAVAERFPVGPVTGNGVVGISNRNHPGETIDGRAGQAAGVAAAVHVLLVGEGSVQDGRVRLVVSLEQIVAFFGRAAHDLPFIPGQRPGSGEQISGKLCLADVMKQPAKPQEVQVLPGHVHEMTKSNCQQAHAQTVLGHVGVFMADTGQPGHRVGVVDDAAGAALHHPFSLRQWQGAVAGGFCQQSVR